MNGLVSVIVPTKNRIQLLKRALASVFMQDYKNIEIIIVNDASHDDTQKFLNSFSSNPRVMVLNLEESVGGAEARNIGLEKCEGEYVAFLDDDDYWYANKISKQVDFIRSNGDVSIVSCSFDSNFLRKVKFKKNITIHLDDLYYINLIGSFSFVLTRRVLIEGIRINKELRACQDWDLWIKILEKSNGRALIIKDALVFHNKGNHHRITNNYSSKTKSTILFLRNHYKNLNELHKYYTVSNLLVYDMSSNLLEKILKSIFVLRLKYYSRKLMSVRDVLRSVYLIFKLN